MSLNYVAALCVVAAIALFAILALLADWAMRAYMAWREKRDMRVRDARLARYNITAFRGTKDRLL